MRVIFTGDPIELEGMTRGQGLSRTSATIYGVHFPMGAEVDVSHLDPKLQQKLANNPHFRPAGIEAPPAPLVVPVSALRPQPEPAAASAEGEADAVDQTRPASASRSRKRA